MNEQLIVKNFGPIKDATVDFKRVTVFIGPTGGGKSTLAKLAAIFRDPFYNININNEPHKLNPLSDFSITNFYQPTSEATFNSGEDGIRLIDFEKNSVAVIASVSINELNREIITKSNDNIAKVVELFGKHKAAKDDIDKDLIINEIIQIIQNNKSQHDFFEQLVPKQLYTSHSHFFPASRSILPAVEYLWAGFL
ncbi:AAA family ATPase [Hymenobacter psoromatis]|uniref:AAA family ATPase n=1 Tax=Hymenobacter psoromatis TaxID=1484116 RepID=UPI001CC1B045|nr:AAA family ATPase [Hymenobacter psoromatis]